MFAAPHETTPVRRHSRLAGMEGIFWQRTARRDVLLIRDAAKRYERIVREPGKRNGPLGHVAIEVLELFANLVSFKTGRLDPSIAWIMGKLKRSKDAVVRALAALREHGFLDWLRRYVPTGNEGKGPVVEQTSNAYRLCLPPRALRLLGRWGQPAPVPDDHDHAREARNAGIDDDELGQALDRLKRAIQRESAKQEESRPGFIPLGGASRSAGEK